MSKLKLEPLNTPFGLVRLLEHRDLAKTLEWRNRDDIRIWFRHSDLLSMESHLGWFQRYLEKEDDFTFVMQTPDEGIVGQIALYNWQRELKMIEIGRIMVGGNNCQGRGIGQASIEALLSTAKNVLNCESVVLEVKNNNDKAIRLYHRCGFQLTNSVDDMHTMHYTFGLDRLKVGA